MYAGVAISGKMGSGKTSVANALVDICKLHGINAVRLSLADPIKAIVHDFLVSLGHELPDNWKYSFRKQMQVMGQGFRNIWSDVYIQTLMHRAKMNQSFSKPTLIIVDDVRYLNELSAFKNNNFFLAHLDASYALRASRIKIECDSHQSETELDAPHDIKFDMIIHEDAVPASAEEYAKCIFELISKEVTTKDTAFENDASYVGESITEYPANNFYIVTSEPDISTYTTSYNSYTWEVFCQGTGSPPSDDDVI